MKILLTGPTGFIGAAFLKAALEQGHEVAALVRPGRLAAQPVQAENLHWLTGTLDALPWTEIERFKPALCVHTAWIATPPVYLEAPENRQYLAWSRDFAERLYAQGAWMLALGTCIEYRITGSPLNEATTPVEPASAYARCKNELRLHLEETSRRHSLPYGWARLFYPYGVGEHPDRLCSSIIRRLQRDETITLRTPDSTKDYIHVGDVARALVLLAEQSAHGCYNIGTGDGVAVRKMAEMIAGFMNRPEKITAAVPAAPDLYPFVVADAAKLKAIGWTPQISLADGLQALVENLCP